MPDTMPRGCRRGADDTVVDHSLRPVADDGSAGNYAAAVATRLDWLTDPAIRAKFLANPNPGALSGWARDSSIQLYGLPMSPPEKHGPFISQRFQRISFQLWVEDVAGMPAKGTVVGVLGGDLVKEAGLLPAAAVQPLSPGGSVLVQPTPTPIPTPEAPTYPLKLIRSWGAPNCGTTYVKAVTTDASGGVVDGITIKNWNDWGNVYIASSASGGQWDRIVSGGAKGGRWYAQVIDDAGNPISELATMDFTDNCDPNAGPAVQQVELEFRRS